MKIDLKDIIGKKKGCNAIVIGLGPSLKPHIEKIKQLSKNENYTIIACNDIDIHTSIDPHYWVWANSEDTIKKIYKRLNKKQETTVVYADSVDLTPRDRVDKLLTVRYIPYDQRHFQGKGCGSKVCCKFIMPERLTIQEELKKYTGYHKHWTHTGTVALNMMTFAILLGCQNIYITGLDLDYSKGYVSGKNAHRAKQFQQSSESFTKNLDCILEMTEIIYNSAQNINVNMYTLDKETPISKILPHAVL